MDAVNAPGPGHHPTFRDRAILRGAGRALALVALLAVIPAPGRDVEAGTAGVRPGSPATRADLAALRRRVALLESTLALARSRKPYLVVDAESKHLRYELLGMTLRDLAAREIDIDGLGRSGEGGDPGPQSYAAILTLKEKDHDPRLSPLTPEQIEGGAADENVADALPPEAPSDYTLAFRQPVVFRIEGTPGKRSVLSRLFDWWPLTGSTGGAGREAIALRLTIQLDETSAREMYRSLLPGERLVVVPPRGFLLPDAGQETPRSVRPGRPARPPVAPPGVTPAGVPFRIPPPVSDAPAQGGAAAEPAAAPPGAGDPAAGGVPAAPAEAAPAPAPSPSDPAPPS